MNEEQQTVHPRPGAQYPDFTEEQKAILLQIANTPAYKASRGYAWRLAFKEHPEWERILLTDQDRPMSHLWHASKELQRGAARGLAPARPFALGDKKPKSKKRNVQLLVVRRGKYKKRKQHWPGIEAIKRKREEMKARKADEVSRFVQTLPPASTTFCPHCGSHKSHFGNQA